MKNNNTRTVTQRLQQLQISGYEQQWTDIRWSVCTHLSTFFSCTLGTVLNLCFLKYTSCETEKIQLFGTWFWFYLYIWGSLRPNTVRFLQILHESSRSCWGRWFRSGTIGIRRGWCTLCLSSAPAFSSTCPSPTATTQKHTTSYSTVKTSVVCNN